MAATLEQIEAEIARRKQVGQPQAPKPSLEAIEAEIARRKQPRSVLNQLTGSDGLERFQTWPERLGRGIAGEFANFVTGPGKAMRGEMPVRDSDGNLTNDAIGWGATGGFFATGLPPSSRAIPQAGASLPKPQKLQAAEAARDLGIELPASVGSGGAGQAASQSLRAIPIVGQPLRNADEMLKANMDDVARSVAQRQGSGDTAGAGAALKGEVVKTAKERIPEGMEQIYTQVGNMIDDSVQIPLRNTRKIANEITSKRQTAALSGEGNAVKFVQEAIARDGMNFEGIKTLRTAMREMLDNPNQLTSAGISKSEGKRIYQALTDDLRSVVETAGNREALEAFDEANTLNVAASSVRETLQKIVGVNTPVADEKIIGYVQRIAGSNQSANIKNLRLLKQSAGESWDEVASAVAAKLGRDKAGEFSPTRFISDYDQMSAMGKQYLFGGKGDATLKKSLDDILAVSKQFKDYESTRNWSGTGGVFAGAVGVLNLYTNPIALLSAATTGRVASQMLSKPVTAKAVARWTKAYQKAASQPTVGNMSVLRKHAKDVAMLTYGRDGPTRETAALIQNLSGGFVKANADGEGEDIPNGYEVPQEGPAQQRFNPASNPNAA